MGVLRWLLGWHRSDEEDDEEERTQKWKKGKGKRRGRSSREGYKVQWDGESRTMRGEAPPFSFWSSARVILILSFLLWWIQPAGPMIAGYVGGRRSGSPMKGVLAALLPVAIVLIANTAYTRGVGSSQIDLVASLPQAFAGGVASVLPFLMPYKDFLVGYMSGFVKALQSTFGMGTNGYLMVLIFAYIGGLIADQTRRELYYKSGSSQSVGFNLIQPLFGGRHAVAEEYEEDDEELRELRRPVRARARGHGSVEIHTGPRRRRHGSPNRFEDYRKLGADGVEPRGARRAAHARSRDEEDEETEEDEDVAPRSHRASHPAAKDHHARAHAAEDADAEDEADEEAVARREAQEARRPRQRSHDEEVRIQRFVERALRNYDHAAR